MIITTARGLVIECDAVTPGAMYPVLHIHTHAISGADAYTIFSNPEETCELTLTEGDGEQQNHRVFRGFTQLFSVQRSPFIPGDLLIWLQLPVDDKEEE